MEIYKFRCKNCGSSRCDRINETTLKCVYCGEIEEIIYETKKQSTQQKTAKDEEIIQTSTQKQQEDIEIKRVPHKERKDFSSSEPAKKDNKNLSKAAIRFIVCIFLGWFGVHRFMEGKIISGIIYACSMGLFYIGWGIDAIINLCRLISEAIKSKG